MKWQFHIASHTPELTGEAPVYFSDVTTDRKNILGSRLQRITLGTKESYKVINKHLVSRYIQYD